METFVEQSNDLVNFEDLLYQGIDYFDSISNMIDLNNLNYPENQGFSKQNVDTLDTQIDSVNSNDPTLEYFQIESNTPISNSDSTSSLSPSSSSSSSSPINSIIFQEASNFLENIDFSNALNGPITISLPEFENNGMKITSEMILNFDPVDTNQLLEQYDILKPDETINLNVLSESSNDTCIDLDDSPDNDDEKVIKIEKSL